MLIEVTLFWIWSWLLEGRFFYNCGRSFCVDVSTLQGHKFDPETAKSLTNFARGRFLAPARLPLKCPREICKEANDPILFYISPVIVKLLEVFFQAEEKVASDWSSEDVVCGGMPKPEEMFCWFNVILPWKLSFDCETNYVVFSNSQHLVDNEFMWQV